MDKIDVIKATGAIHISHKITLLQQQVWNVLLAHAFNDLGTKVVYTMKESDLLEYIPYETRNTEIIKEALKVLNTTQIEYNLFSKDKKKRWGIFTLLAGAKLENGELRYGYFEDLRHLLNTPEMYSKINLLIQNKFSSKYALFLYELCVDYLGIEQTPIIALDDFRKYMGIEPNEYPEFKNLNRRVLSVALREINERSDLSVSVTYKREHLSITGLKFKISKKSSFQTPKFPMQEGEFLENKSTVIALKETLISCGVSHGQATQIIESYRVDQITTALDVLKNSSQPVRNVGAFVKRAIEEGWITQAYDPKEEAIRLKLLEEQRRLKEAENRYLNLSNQEKLSYIVKQFLYSNASYSFLNAENKEIALKKIESTLILKNEPYSEIKKKSIDICSYVLRFQHEMDDHFDPIKI